MVLEGFVAVGGVINKVGVVGGIVAGDGAALIVDGLENVTKLLS